MSISSRTISAINRMIQDMQYLVDHPRMEQRNWVAKGKEWLPILDQTVSDLQMKSNGGVTVTITALQRMIQDMQHLVDHPRMQQFNWVMKGTSWLPILQDVIEDLQDENQQEYGVNDEYQQLLDWLERIGLQVIQRSASNWGFQWHDGELKGAYKSRIEALQAGLRERLVR